MAGKEAVIDQDHYWITQKNRGSGYSVTLTVGGNPPSSQSYSTGILYNCPTTVVGTIDPNGTQSNGQGATVDVYFECGEVKAIRCKLPYTGSVSTNGYAIGE